MNSKVRCLLGTAAIVVASQAAAQSWTERWPTSTVIVSENFVSEYLRATFGKIGSMAANELNAFLNNPGTQLKVATSVGDWIRDLNADPTLTPDDKARQFLGVAEFDFGPWVSAPGGSLNITAQFSPTLSISRLVWDRHYSRFNCQRIINGNLRTETWDVEAQYMIYRNGKFLAQIGEQVRVSDVAGVSVGFSWSDSQGVNWKRPNIETPNPVDTTTKAGPFYDFDPYNLPLGTRVQYEIRSYISGCGPNTMGPGFGSQSRYSQLVFDADGNAQPDFYPAAELAAKRASGMFMGSQVPGSGPIRDGSQKVKVVWFEREAVVSSSVHKDFQIKVPPEYVVIGGGVRGAGLPYGHFVTASYPSPDFSSWIVSTKDHYYQNPTRIKAYALAMKVEGRPREQLIQDLLVTSSTSPSASQPDATASIPAGYVMIGGGFRIDWTGLGVLGTASYPTSPTTWRAQGKDHIYAQSAPVTAYAIGLKNYIPGVGTVGTVMQSIGSGYGPTPNAVLDITPGYAVTGCGAKVNWSGYGSLLVALYPTTWGLGQQCFGSSKEHHSQSSATIDVHSIGIAVLP